MKKEVVKFEMEIFDSISDMDQSDVLLLEKARAATKKAYAPYSGFRVGAVALLVNGEFVEGTNQENASFPAGICAERVLLSTSSSLFPEVGIRTMAISYDNLNGRSDSPISPCGICRQSLMEFQSRTDQPIRLILGGLTGQVYIIPDAGALLPLVFSAEDMA